jgi:hypothetical protein
MLMAAFHARLRDLEPCSRGEAENDERCVDRGLAAEDAIRPGDLTCGCGCWTRPAVEDGVPYVSHLRVVRDEP